MLNYEDSLVIAKAIEIMERQVRGSDYLNRPEDVKAYLRLTTGPADHEIFTCVFLDVQNRVIASEKMFEGTLTQCTVYPREIVRRALFHNAAALIVSHNHPSGNQKPSMADINLTANLKKSLETVDIRLLDHILITCEDNPVSFAEGGYI